MREDGSEKQEPAPRRMSEEHEAILDALRGMERSLDALAHVWERDWREHARSELLDVATSIERHCRFAEAPQGLLAQLERDVGRSQHVSAAHQAHQQLTEQANALIAAMSNNFEADLARHRAGELMQTLRQHLALEVELVYDTALDADVGIGD